jgi:hypothetical protein
MNLALASQESDCPNFANHTKSPEGYNQFFDWCHEMNKTHKQTRCTDCGLWTIWVPRDPTNSEQVTVEAK